MARMKDYTIWAAEKIEKDYPGYSFDVYMKLVTESNVATNVERYSIEKYLEEVNND